MRRLAPLLAIVASAAALAVVAQLVVRAQTGPLPLAGVFEIHLLAGAAVLALLALLGSLGGGRRQAWTRLTMLAVIVLAVVRVGGEVWSPEVAEGASSETALSVLSWNLEMESKSPADVAAGLAAIDADVVALQELTPAFAAGIEADATLMTRYPYRILEARPGAAGLGLLAKRPLIVRGLSADGRATPLRAGLLLEDGRTLEILNVHPTRPGYTLWGPLPVSLDTRGRDADVARFAALGAEIDGAGAARVVGDLNGTPSEVGLQVLIRALVDTHAAVGTGPGFTWRPDQLEDTGAAVLRIDYVLVGAWMAPTSTSVDCAAAGDHCRLLVTLRVAPATP